ncbi:MAG TPA: ATP-binding protein [Blastocatellia bacterium]|nr:ATP-binding protein [Blastocatellia bacterium]
MNSRNRALIFRYGIAVLAFGAALLITQLLWPLIDPAATPLFFAAVMVAAFYGGLGPGLLATALSTWAVDFFFIAPFNAMELTVANLVRAGVFMLVAIIISWLNAARKKLMDDLRERNRERETLLTQISGFNNELRSQVEAATRDLSASNQALLQTQQRLIRSERLAVAGQMAASLAHEIGTPLNAISGHLQLLARDHPDAPDTQRRVQIITKQLEFIVGIVRRLLEWAHKKQLRFRPTDLNLLMREVLTLVSPALEQHAIAVSTDLADGLPPAPVDRDGLNQVFLNLINNSLDAMPDGGRLEVSSRFDHDNGMAELMLRDTGVGVDSGALEHIFEPMWTTKPSGSGFGLAIAREIITEHGGQIEAVCEQRQGATFIVRLPLDEASAAPKTRKEAPAYVA